MDHFNFKTTLMIALGVSVSCCVAWAEEEVYINGQYQPGMSIDEAKRIHPKTPWLSTADEYCLSDPAYKYSISACRDIKASSRIKYGLSGPSRWWRQHQAQQNLKQYQSDF